MVAKQKQTFIWRQNVAIGHVFINYELMFDSHVCYYSLSYDIRNGSHFSKSAACALKGISKAVQKYVLEFGNTYVFDIMGAFS